MKQIGIFFCVLSFFNFNCTKDNSTDATGTIIKLSALWSTSTTDGSIGEVLVREAILYDNGILVSGKQNDSKGLLMLDVNTGLKKWTWQDYPINYSPYSLEFPTTSGSNLICNEFSFNINVDLKTGKTIWKNTFNNYVYDKLNIFFNNTIYCGSRLITKNSFEPAGACVLDMQTGTPQFLLPVKIDTTNVLAGTGYSGEASCVYPFVYNLDTLISIVVTDAPITGYKYRLTTCLYNWTKKQWVYERMPLFDASNNGVNGKPVVFANNMYVCSGGKSVCFNMLTGEKKWTNNFTEVNEVSSFLLSTPLLADGKIFVQNEDLYLFCIDPNTGATLWKQGIFGTCSHMAYLNGVVYFVCGGDGKLYAIDAANGNKLWAISSPDVKISSQASFDRYVGLVPPQNGQKGKIVVTTGLNAYCYEAYK